MVMMVSVRFVTVLVFFVRMRMPVFMVAVMSVRFFLFLFGGLFLYSAIHPAEVATRSKSNMPVWIIFFKFTSA